MNTSPENFCIKPYVFFEIGTDGYCYCCSRLWNDSYCLGNILEQSFEDVWNGEKAQAIRQSIIDKNYKYCDLNLCLMPTNKAYSSPIADLPEEVSLCYDNSCAQNCVYCRDKANIMSEEECKKWDDMIEPVFIPMLKNAKLVTVNVAGEIFISKHSKKLVKRIAEEYPDIKFAILTNGVYCTEENLKKLGIADKISDIRVSVPSCKEDTYKKIVRNGDFHALIKNLKYIAELKKQGKIDVYHFNCVVTSLNYKDLVLLTEFAKECGAVLHAMIVQNLGQNTHFLQELDRYLVNKDTHPEYNNFVKIMHNPIIQDDSCFMINETFKKLKPVTLKQSLINKAEYFKRYVLKDYLTKSANRVD